MVGCISVLKDRKLLHARATSAVGLEIREY